MSADSDPFLGQPTARIMLLGMFHFQDRGLDWYKPHVGFDVFSERRQQEIAEVLETSAREKVCAERPVRQR